MHGYNKNYSTKKTKVKLLMSLGIFYPSQVGGPGNTLYWMSKEMVKKGVEVTVVVSDEGVARDFAPRDSWFDLGGIKIKYCSVKRSQLSPKLIWQTLKEVKKNNVVMLSSMFYVPNFFVGLMSLICGKKVIWSPRGELLVPRRMVKMSFLKIVKLLFAKKVTFHATSPEEVTTVYERMGKDAKCIIIPNYMLLPTKVEAGNDEKYFLYVGRIMPIKALEKLIEGVSKSKLFAAHGYKLYLAGKNEGEYYENLLSLVQKLGLEEQIVFKGMVEGSDKEYLYAGAKATMLVSRTENFGNVIIESLAQGTPTVTSLGTPWQILEQTGAGYWIENSPEIIGETIDKILSLSDEEYSQMRQKAYELCHQEFDIQNNINKWIDIL